MPMHVAFKCTYNDGGENPLVGFAGSCSEQNMKRNIEAGRVWCSQPRCECTKYYRRGFRGARPDYPCNESGLFTEWRLGAGTYHNGPRAGQPMRLRQAKPGAVAILTTRFPGDAEMDRAIIGFYQVKSISDPEDCGTQLIGTPIRGVRLPLQEARSLYFWDYYANKKRKSEASWGTLLFRYLDDQRVATILNDLKSTVQDERTRHVISDLLTHAVGSATPGRPSGPRARSRRSRAHRVAMLRKYGPGGEGRDHRRLKLWVSKHPQALGLSQVKKVQVEHSFPSGDRADVVFDMAGGRYAVVEVETLDALPGCYQALKYKTLRCAELSLCVASSKVEAITVAWTFNEGAKRLCNRYGIRRVVKRL